ncbi:MAG: hypothetical protein WC789_12525 [Lentisphaeria bacterium]|jgi:hypothetical protein
MTPKKAIAWGCGIVAAISVAGIAAVVLFFFYMSRDPKGVRISVDGPTDVVVGQGFALKISIVNERPRKVLALSDIDIAEDYLAGFTVSTIDPPPKSSMHVPIDNSRSFTFGIQIPPGEARSFTFNLRAEKAGVYRGDVDVCEGARFITGMAQTAVKEKE